MWGFVDLGLIIASLILLYKLYIRIGELEKENAALKSVIEYQRNNVTPTPVVISPAPPAETSTLDQPTRIYAADVFQPANYNANVAPPPPLTDHILEYNRKARMMNEEFEKRGLPTRIPLKK